MIIFWKNLRLSKKIIFAFGVIVLAICIMTAFFLYAVSVLSSSMSVMERADRVAENMLLREIDHLQWVNTLQSYVFQTDQMELKVQTDPTLCAFGKWYSSKQRIEAEEVFPAAKALLAEIDEPHKKLHASAVVIARLRQAGKQKELEAYYIGNTLKNLEAVKTALLDTRKAVNEEKKISLATFTGASKIAQASAWGGTSVAMVLALSVALLTFRSIGQPIERLAQYANAVAAGDYAARFTMKRRDEFGQLSDSINHMVEKMVAVIARANNHAQEADDHAQKTRQAMDRAEKAQQEASQAMRRGLQEAANRLESITAKSVNVCALLAKNVSEALQGAEKQREYSAESAETMVQMSAAILNVASNASTAADNSREVKKNAESGAGIVHSTIVAIEDMRKKTSSIQESMNGLGKQVEGIGHVMSVISDIADQTNLLALNAAIEAARAGDAGRGFAVVAGEVRKLAEKTMLATKEVSNVVTGIQQSAVDNVKSVEQAAGMVGHSTELARSAGESLAQIVAHATDAAEKIGTIAASCEEQSSACEEINKGSDKIRHLAEANSTLMRQADSAMQDMNRLIIHLSSLQNELKTT